MASRSTTSAKTDPWTEPDPWREDEPFPIRTLGLVVGTLLAATLVFIWASTARLDVVTRGQGRVIASAQAQVVQSLEGGILSDILVEEGSSVEVGQVVARIDDTRFAAELGEQRIRYEALRLRALRLNAEARDNAEVLWPTEESGAVRPLVEEEQALWQARRDELASAIAVLETEASQQALELEENKTRIRSLTATLDLAKREAAILAPGVERGSVPEIEVIRQQRDVVSLQGEIAAAQAAQTRIIGAITLTRNRIAERRSTFRSASQRELNDTNLQLAALGETIRAAADRVNRTEIRSPVRGIVNKLDTTTRGSILQPGRTLMEITPIDDSLLVEVRLRPADIGFLHPGLRARVSLTAYDTSQFGSLDGEVVRISPDTITDPKGETFYKAIVRTQKNALEHRSVIHRIIPGMDASVDIMVGDRTVLGYFLKPILRTTSEAFRER
jgi:adhesin transport system membrane fusion protein